MVSKPAYKLSVFFCGSAISRVQRPRTGLLMKVTVVVPAKNEAETIGAVLSAVEEYADELIVVDGHSDDGTTEIAKRFGARVVFDGGMGKGDAVRTAIREATGDLLVFIDADGSHVPKDIPKLLAPLLSDGRHGPLRTVAWPADHHAGHKLPVQCSSDRFPERISGDTPGRRDRIGPEGEHHHHRAGNGDESAEDGLPGR